MSRKSKYKKDEIINEALKIFSYNDRKNTILKDFLSEICENLRIPSEDSQKVKYMIKTSKLFQVDKYNYIYLTDKGRLETKSEKSNSGEDKRDKLMWVALELTPVGEQKIVEGKLEEIVKSYLGSNIEVFIPSITYIRDKKNIALHLMEGYIFISSGLEDEYYFELEHTPYINKVMTIKNRTKLRQLSVVEDDVILNMKKELKNLLISTIKIGDNVLVMKGSYKNLEGVVYDIENEFAELEISLRSATFLTRLPKVFLEPYDSYNNVPVKININSPQG